MSPTTVVDQNSDKYQGFIISTNCDNEQGTLKLLHRDGVNHTTYNMFLENSLWYHRCTPTQHHIRSICKLNDACDGSLWYSRLNHVEETVISKIHKHLKGVDCPIKLNKLHKRPTCIPNKMSKRSYVQIPKQPLICTNIGKDDPESEEDDAKGESGQISTWILTLCVEVSTRPNRSMHPQ